MMALGNEGTQSFCICKSQLRCTSFISAYSFNFVEKYIAKINGILQIKLSSFVNVDYKKSKEKDNQLESTESVSDGFVSPIIVGNSCPLEQDAIVAGPSKPKFPRIEGSFLERLKASLKEEITSEIKNLLCESPKEMLKLLKPEIRENIKENTKEETENETRNFYTPTKLYSKQRPV